MATMTRTFPLLLLACAVAACSRERAPEPAKPATAKPAPATDDDAGNAASPAPAATRLTIYSGDYDALAGQPPRAQAGMPGFALVETDLRYKLQGGANRITFDRLPRALDVASVILRAKAPANTVQGQRFLDPPGDAGSVLAGAVGHRVAVEHTSGGARQVDNGTLVAAGDGLTLALADGRTKVIREYDNVSLLDPEQQPAAEPSLRWQVLAQDAGTAAFDLAYATAGLAWRAEYLARLAKGDTCRLSLDGAAMVSNRSGMDYRNIALTLVAGEPARVQPAGRERFAVAEQAMAAPAPPAAGYPQPRASGEYYAYPIPGRTTLDDAALERVPLFAPLAAVACERGYETAPAGNSWEPSQPIVAPGFGGDTGPQPVHATVAIANTRQAGLGQPLPAGRLRIFDAGDFLGESQLGHTPEGTDLHLEVGTAFDLTAERERVDFTLDRAGRQMTESFRVTLRNARARDATITVVEPLPRWSDWEITGSSVPATRRDAQHAEFSVPVPAAGETVLAYTVRYRWPAGVRP
jgi:hypothetical protein